MTLLGNAKPLHTFTSWLPAHTRQAVAQTSPPARRGRAIFLTQPCADCHELRGTRARGHVGPALTHLASRATLAANTIRDDQAELAEWVHDPQHVKPGNRMPAVRLSPGDLDAVVAYLHELR